MEKRELGVWGREIRKMGLGKNYGEGRGEKVMT